MVGARRLGQAEMSSDLLQNELYLQPPSPWTKPHLMRDDAKLSTSSPGQRELEDGPTAALAPLSIDNEKKPFARPRFDPTSPKSSSRLLDLLVTQAARSGQKWHVSLAHDVHFSRAAFFSAVKDLALHPERNSSVILRADPLPPRASPLNSSPATATLHGHAHQPALEDVDVDEEATQLGMERREEFRLRLMPKQVKRDGKLDQRIAIYQSTSHRGSEVSHDSLNDSEEEHAINQEQGMVLMVPEAKALDEIPYYHPPVSKLAFLYESTGADEDQMDPTSGEQGASDEATTTMPMQGRIYIAYFLFSHDLSTGRNKDSLFPPDPASPVNPLLDVARRTPPKRRSPLSQSSSDDRDQVSTQPATVFPVSPRSKIHGAAITHSGIIDGIAPPNSSHLDQNRLDRTLRALLEKVYKYGYHSITPYQKRVHHDILVQRESFQDLYLELKERHRHLESRAQKPGSTKIEDVKRHVWKAAESSTPSDPSLPLSDVSHWGSQDIAIAAFLMLLWKDMYPPVEPVRGSEGRRWDTWGRPAGGFVDLGCGNGLLVHILLSEGYAGRGYELRARRTWPMYPPETRAALVELPIDFPSWFPNDIQEWDDGSWAGRESCPITDESFIIGNHADEITPWIPLLSLLPSSPVPSLSLPCCLHTLDGPFTKLNFTPPSHPHSPVGNFGEGLEDGQGRYKSYIMWLGWHGLMCGWEWEKECLRIPSTKGWAIVARRRWTTSKEELRQCRVWALEQVNGVRQRGAFRVREREGKDH